MPHHAAPKLVSSTRQCTCVMPCLLPSRTSSCTHGIAPALVLSHTVPALYYFSLTSFSQGSTCALLGLPCCKTNSGRLHIATLHHITLLADRFLVLAEHLCCALSASLGKSSCTHGTPPAHVVMWASTALGVCSASNLL